MPLPALPHRFRKSANAAAIGLFALSLCLLTLEWCVFRMSVHPDRPSWIATFLKGMADMGVILSPFFFLRPRRRWLVMVPVVLMSLFFLANILYFRVFGQLLPFESILFWKNFDATLWDSVAVLFRGADLVYVFPPLLVAAYLAAVKRVSAPPPFRPATGLWAVAVALVYYVLVYTYIFLVGLHHERQDTPGVPAGALFRSQYFNMVPTQRNVRHDTGLLHYLVIEAVRETMADSRIEEYTAAQRADIESLLALRRDQYVPADTAFLGNRDKNLILIIVESLNTECINKRVNGVTLTPTLNSLVGREGTVAALNVVSQVGDGRSSDGQMLYNTGLLPLRRGAAAMNCAGNRYVGLPHLLGKATAVEMICESRYFWNHATTSEQYGYDRLYDQESLADAKGEGYDQALFRFALSELPRLPRPFLAELTTLSMHQPFNKVGAFRNDTLLASFPDQPDLAHYYNTVKYFDQCLGRFLDGLEASGLARESVVVIVADHNEFFVYGNGVRPSPIPFIALNTGTTRRIDKAVGQCDIFPTLLDIMGVTQPGLWRGVGLSIFNPLSGGALDRDGTLHLPDDTAALSADTAAMRRAWTVSDLLLRGRGSRSFASDNGQVLSDSE